MFVIGNEIPGLMTGEPADIQNLARFASRKIELMSWRR